MTSVNQRMKHILESILLRKNLKRLLILINISIFLSVFAISATIVSIIIENQISKKEIYIQSESSYLNDFKKLGTQLPLYRTIVDSVYQNDINLNRYYKILENIDKYDALVDNREFYFDRAIAIHRFNDNFYQDFENDMDSFINDVNNFYESYFFDDPDSENAQYITNRVKSFYEEYQYLDNQYKNIKDDYSTTIGLPEELFSDDDEDKYDYYFDFHTLALDRYNNAEEFLYLMEAMFSDIISVFEYDIVLVQEEIKNLSKYEVWIIFIAFILQIIIFMILQVFEISIITRDNEEKL